MVTKEAVNEEAADFSALVAPDETKDTAQVYELGYHIIPTVPEDSITAEAEKVAGLLKQPGIEMIGERTPAMVPLAYTIEKVTGGTKRSYDSAYFGWVAFVAPPASLVGIEQAFRANEQVLRHIIIKTSRDAVAAQLADPSLDFGAHIDAPDADAGGDAVSDTELDTALGHIEDKEKEAV